MAPATEVFNTIELFEQIVVQLPLRDVLPLMRVSKSCQATVLGSSIIQKAMFQLPSNIRVETVWKTKTLNLNEVIGLGNCDQSLSYADDLKEKEDTSQTVATSYHRLGSRPSNWNPFAFVVFGGQHELYHRYEPQKKHLQDTGTSHSWKTMFVLQPPVKVVELDLKLKTEELYRRAKMAARHKEKTQRTSRWPDDLKCTNEGGVTFGDVAKAMSDIWEEMQHFLEAEELEGHGGVLEFDILNNGAIDTVWNGNSPA